MKTVIKPSSILKWSSGNRSKSNAGKSSWIHSPEALQGSHIVYLVKVGTIQQKKFLGNTEVDSSKGIDVVKQGIQKLKFNQDLKRAEGTKIPKVELTISVDGVTIQDPKSKKISHQYPLHRISYCADDKTDPKFFSFIAKEENDNKHNCFVFISEKLAEEITLTIGQAFELAYKRFLDTSGKDLEMRKLFMVLQKRVKELEKENAKLKKQLEGAEKKKKINGICKVSLPSVNIMDLTEEPTVGKRLENLELNPKNVDNNQTVNGEVSNGQIKEKDIFGFEPFNPEIDKIDPFGMGSFGAKELEQGIEAIDKRLAEMRDGFGRGLSFGNDDFAIESLDPFN